MTWFRVDDKLHDHRKTRAAGLEAIGLWSLAGSWCADNLTDGFVPADVLGRWGRRTPDLARRLVGAGLWVEDSQNGERGYRFHDWKSYQVTRDDIEERRRQWRIRQARSRGEHSEDTV